MIVTRGRLMAPGADRHRSSARPDVHFDAFLVGAEAGLLVDESPLTPARPRGMRCQYRSRSAA
jgi:hypothetical protein